MGQDDNHCLAVHDWEKGKLQHTGPSDTRAVSFEKHPRMRSAPLRMLLAVAGFVPCQGRATGSTRMGKRVIRSVVLSISSERMCDEGCLHSLLPQVTPP